MRFHHFLPLAILIAAVGCQPIEEEGIDLPGAPSASFDWEYLYVDTAATPYVDSNRVVFTSLAGDGFLHFWDFGNNLTSMFTMDFGCAENEDTVENRFSKRYFDHELPRDQNVLVFHWC